jgi:DNA-binding transcriptional MocR family regulator
LNYITYDTSFHIWISLPPGVSSTEKTVELYRSNVLVADGADAVIGNPENGFIRVALGGEGEDRRLWEALVIVRGILPRMKKSNTE